MSAGHDEHACVTSSSGGGGPCPRGCAAHCTSPTPSHTLPAACMHIETDRDYNAVASQQV